MFRLMLVLGFLCVGCKSDEPDEPSPQQKVDTLKAKGAKSQVTKKVELNETLPPSDVSLATLLGVPREDVHKATGEPSEDRYVESWDDFVIGDVKASIKYQNGRTSSIWLSTNKRVAFVELKEWAGFPTKKVVVDTHGDEWRFSGQTSSDETVQFFFAASDALPSWHPRLNKMLGKDAKQVGKALMGFQKHDESLYSSVENSVDVSVRFSEEDGKVQSLTIDLDEGVDAVRQQAAFKKWAGLKSEEEQRFNGVIYSVEYSGHGVFFQRRFGKYTQRELDERR